MNDETYVRGVWEGIVTSGFNWPNNGKAGVSLARHNQPVFSRATWPEAWSAAAEYTRTRLEQVRQLREEIALVLHEYKKASVCGVSMAGPTGKALTWSRTLARLESALATLTQGMKPEAQP